MNTNAFIIIFFLGQNERRRRFLVGEAVNGLVLRTWQGHDNGVRPRFGANMRATHWKAGLAWILAACE